MYIIARLDSWDLPICCAKLSENLCRKDSTSVKARHGVPFKHTVLGFFLFSWYTARLKTGFPVNSAHIIRNYRKKALRISRNINFLGKHNIPLSIYINKRLISGPFSKTFLRHYAFFSFVRITSKHEAVTSPIFSQ
jgi:hypothetical protein